MSITFFFEGKKQEVKPAGAVEGTRNERVGLSEYFTLRYTMSDRIFIA